MTTYVFLRLIEYCWNVSTYTNSGNVLDFTDENGNSLPPRSITKDVKMTLRIRHAGRRRLKKFKWKQREEMVFSLKGSCHEEKRREIEFYAKKNAKFYVQRTWIDGGNTYNAPKIFWTNRALDDAYCASWNDRKNEFDEIFIIFKDVKFTQIEGKIGWYDYIINLERVNCQDIAGYEDWTCDEIP